MNVAEVNEALYRKIKTGKQYDKYFPKTSCKATFLINGTTTEGMEQMKIWSKKYQSQTRQLSKDLKGRTVATTVNNIYKFLYEHLQYDADGWDQQLRSPLCSWSTRKQGIDCKSYSVFASTILSNLGIDHAFRKVKQFKDPTRWSHVYVVVKDGDKELIIDGTKHQNIEVNYLDKEDMQVEAKLPYYGLNAPVATLPDNEMRRSVRKFVEFLSLLEQRGVSKATTSKIKTLTKNFVESGQDPVIKLTGNVLHINNYAFQLSNSPEGMGFVSDAVNVFGKIEKGFNHIFKSGFGQVFANGFNLSCWGAAYPPSKSEPETKAYVDKILSATNLAHHAKSGNFKAMENALNTAFVQLAGGERDRKRVADDGGREGKASCTIKGERKASEIFGHAKNGLLEKVKSINDPNLTITISTGTTVAGHPFKESWKLPTQHPVVKIERKNMLQNNGVGNNNSVDATGGGKSKPKQAGIGSVATIAALVLAGGFFLVKNS